MTESCAQQERLTVATVHYLLL